MKPDDILTMEPGREMDALVAERVMGWRWAAARVNLPDTGVTWARFLVPPSHCLLGGERWALGGEPLNPYYSRIKPPFSTNAGCAWELVEGMRARWRTTDQEELYWQFVDCQEFGWRVEIMYSHHDGDVPVECASGETFPLAVCRAALRVIAMGKVKL